MSENDCVICKLVAGELEVSVIHQDDVCVAFMDIQRSDYQHRPPREELNEIAQRMREKLR